MLICFSVKRKCFLVVYSVLSQLWIYWNWRLLNSDDEGQRYVNLNLLLYWIFSGQCEIMRSLIGDHGCSKFKGCAMLIWFFVKVLKCVCLFCVLWNSVHWSVINYIQSVVCFHCWCLLLTYYLPAFSSITEANFCKLLMYHWWTLALQQKFGGVFESGFDATCVAWEIMDRIVLCSCYICMLI